MSTATVEPRAAAAKHAATVPVRVRAKYDSAQTTHSNARHWMNADGLSAVASNSPEVRRVLRQRSRYEIANDSIAQGMIETLVNDTVGTCPRLQLTSNAGAQTETDKAVEQAFKMWGKGAKFGSKMRLARRSKVASGEVFVFLTRGLSRSRVGRTGVELGLHLVEADQIETPTLYMTKPDQVSGIEFDSYGNPTHYHLLDHHPGALGAMLDASSYKPVSADLVLHYFDRKRPGDARGIPEITSALDLFAQRRRWRGATLEAAEQIANIAGVLQTDAPADGDADEVPAGETIDMERGTLLSLPYGWKMGQAKAEQPTATFVQFQNALIAELARCLKMPFNMAAGDSSSSNYASGRLDHQAYFKAITVERAEMIDVMLDPIFWAWFEEARLVRGLLPAAARTEKYARSLATSWFFDGSGHVDPSKEAQGQKTRLETGTTTLAIECAREGNDWREIVAQRSTEKQYLEEMGLTSAATAPGSDGDQNNDEDELDDKIDEKVREQSKKQEAE